MSYLERLREAEKILESGPPPSAKSAKTPLEPTSGTFVTTPPCPFRDFFSDSAIVSCDDCRHYRPDPVGHGGLGHCLTEAPESQRPGSLWPGSRLFCASFAGGEKP